MARNRPPQKPLRADNAVAAGRSPAVRSPKRRAAGGSPATKSPKRRFQRTACEPQAATGPSRRTGKPPRQTHPGVAIALSWGPRTQWGALPMLRRVAEHTIAAEGFRQGALSIAVVGARRMARLHKRYLGIPGPTDVLTFDLGTDLRRRRIEGEVVVCADVALQRASARGFARRAPLAPLAAGGSPADHAGRSARRGRPRDGALGPAHLRAAREELALYVVHGILHLSGYDDRDARGFEQMHAREDSLLRAVGLGAVFARGAAPDAR